MRPPPSRSPRHRIARTGRILAVSLAPLLVVTLRAGLPAGQASSDQAPTRWGIGREATPAEIAALDIDIPPDGIGLPPGGGTVARGAEVYVERCQECHGPNGRDGQFDQLSGREPREGFPFATQPGLRKTIGNYWPYATTLFDYTRRAMPFDEPGTLQPDEVYSLVAYILYLNELVSESAVMNADTLPEVVMPARDRFVADDRDGGPVVR